MDAVKSFNMELSSLYEVKPPISKAKMTALTRGAIKAIKFYKHVVQSVEKFILKCKPEYKVPGLYVIDSIVRQSRHQFGSDKDVFAPRFAKNMTQTFINLFKCPAEDKSKIIRVLNLWQKNHVFQPEVIQPLFDLADPNNPIYKELEISMQQQSANGLNANSSSIIKGSPAMQRTPTKGNQQGNESLHGAATALNLTDPSVIQQLQQLQRLISKNVENSSRSDQVHFDKKLLDFDYGDEDDEIHPSPRQQASSDAILPVTNLLTNPEVLRQLQTLQQTMANAVQPQNQEIDLDKMRKLQEMKQQEDEFDKHLAQTVPNLPFAAECDFRGTTNPVMGGNYFADGAILNPPPPLYPPDFDASGVPSSEKGRAQDDGADVEVITLDHDDSRTPTPEERYKKRRRSRSRSRDRRGRDRDRRRSRSRSGSRRRNRSRSRDRSDRFKKDKEKSKEEKEKESERERERKKRGLPVIKKDCLSICSTTLWVGHLSKLVHQDDLSNTFGEFGDVVSIDLIPPRGCAFIVMLRRQDAARCLTKLKGHNLHGKSITLAWAPGKGVKGKDLKDYWEGDLGVSYIPYAKLKPDIDIDMLEDGGMIDEETMPAWMKEKVERMGKKPSMEGLTGFMPSVSGTTIDTSQPPPIPGAGLLQPPPMMPLFQFNNRLLGMNVPPGMMPSLSNMPNIPIGVPPPNMAGAQMMSNSLLGLGSPFQGPKHHLLGPPNIMPPQLPSLEKSGINADATLHNLGKSLLNITQSFGVVPHPPAPHDDPMDVEMEDADKPADKPASFNDQFARGRDDRDRRNRSRDRDVRDRERSRDRHGREKDRDRRYNRDPPSRSRDRDRRDDRRDNREQRNNRWGDRDRRDRSSDRREREKTLNDRLREMAGMGGYDDSRDRNRERFRDRDNNLKFVPPARSNGRQDEEFDAFRQRDRFDRRGKIDDGQSDVDKSNENPDADEQSKADDGNRKDGSNADDDKDDNKDVMSECELNSAQDESLLDQESGDAKISEIVLDGDIPPGVDEPLDNDHNFSQIPFETPLNFEALSSIIQDGPARGMFNDVDGPPRSIFDDLRDGPPLMFDDMRGGMRGRGRGGGGGGGRRGRYPMRMDGPPDLLDMLEGPPMMDGLPPDVDAPHLLSFRDERFSRGGRRRPDGEFFPPREDFGPRGPPLMLMRGRGRGGRGQFFPRTRGSRGGFNPRFEGPPFDGPPFDGPLFPGPPFEEPLFRGPRGGRGFRHGRFEERNWMRSGEFKQPARGGRRSRWGGEQDDDECLEDSKDFNDRPHDGEEGEGEGDEEEVTGELELMDRREPVEDAGDNSFEASNDGKSTPVVDERPLVQEREDEEDVVKPPGTEDVVE
ncbi:unnamed protein product [Phyllotreta striolata]|uniref:Uncharacterized protein n=1 Tax=Phyllotreta striolata TaxID=444603 RepID=A0A9N9TKG6_PHYSR|nr:unnamed protein product [Phyllotreta striolata]